MENVVMKRIYDCLINYTYICIFNEKSTIIKIFIENILKNFYLKMKNNKIVLKLITKATLLCPI